MDHTVYTRRIARDAVRRAAYFTTLLWNTPLLALWAPRGALADDPFVPVETLTPEQATSVAQASAHFDINEWADRGMAIRAGVSNYQCLANLTAVLDLVGQLNAAKYNGAAGALSLLPTAGALLGSPTREMWIVYKLVPLAGIFTMFLSLGGSITPSNVGEYDPSEPFSYGGFMPTTRVTAARPRPYSLVASTPGAGSIHPMVDAAEAQDHDDLSAAQQFAEEVRQRADDDSGGGIVFGVFFAMAIQLILIVALLIPMWYAQRGAVIAWWCRAWGWMYFWYFLVSTVSVFDNLVAAPFTQSWTIRVSRRPTGILLDETVRKITDRRRYRNALEAIKAGPNTNQRIRISADRSSGYSRTCFYVVVSVQGISRLHAIAQIVSKAASVAVFAFGTALFASATLMAISATLMILCLLLACGVAGRVLAMWIVAQISRQNKPILHKLVRSENEAGKYIHAIAELDLQLEINGHVILNGWCVKSRSPLFSPATYIGLLAKPFNAIALAERSRHGTFSSLTMQSSAPTGFTYNSLSNMASEEGGGYSASRSIEMRNTIQTQSTTEAS